LIFVLPIQDLDKEWADLHLVEPWQGIICWLNYCFSPLIC